MTDEYGNETTAPQAERVGYCQDCGKPLTKDTIRMVGSGVFCEPCLETRVGATVPPVGAVPVGAGPSGGAYVPPQQAPVSHAPSPTLAGFLGLIPGVGAMYNGQFAKGIAHLVIFFVLSSLSDHVNGAFGILVAGWVFYQAFEAYHTAKARLLGDPLPNPLGLNDIGERMGFGKTSMGSTSRPPVTPATEWVPVTPTGAAPTTVPVPPVPPANWTGYVPPTAFAQAPVVPVQAAPVVAESASWGTGSQQAPYQAPSAAPYPAATYQAAPFQAATYQAGPVVTHYVPVDPAATLPTAAVPPATSRRFPVAALVLIVLGLLFLLNTIMHFAMNGSWITAAIFACLSVWMFAHRVSQLRREFPEDMDGAAMVSGLLRWPPVMLAVLAVLFFLQAAEIYTLGQTWPVIVIAFGAMLLIERAAGRAVSTGYMDSHPPLTPAMTPSWVNEPVAAVQTVHAGEPVTRDDAEIGGQR